MSTPLDQFKTHADWRRVVVPPGVQLPWRFFRPGGGDAQVIMPSRGVTIIAGRPSMGKTTAMMALAVHAAQQWDEPEHTPPPVLYATNDQSAPELAAKLDQVVDTIEHDAIRILEAEPYDVESIEALLHAAVKRWGGARMVLWDFLQFFSTAMSQGGYERSDERIKKIMMIIKGVARALGCPQLIGSQVNRDSAGGALLRKPKPKAEKYYEPSFVSADRPVGGGDDAPAPPRPSTQLTTIRECVWATSNRRPQLHQLRDGGSEQGADIAIGIQRLGGDLMDAAVGAIAPGIVEECQKVFVLEVLKDRHSSCAGALSVCWLAETLESGPDRWNPFDPI